MYEKNQALDTRNPKRDPMMRPRSGCGNDNVTMSSPHLWHQPDHLGKEGLRCHWPLYPPTLSVMRKAFLLALTQFWTRGILIRDSKNLHTVPTLALKAISNMRAQPSTNFSDSKILGQISKSENINEHQSAIADKWTHPQWGLEENKAAPFPSRCLHSFPPYRTCQLDREHWGNHPPTGQIRNAVQ